MTRQNQGHGKGKVSKSQRKDDQERKRDERVIKAGYSKQRKDQSYLADDDNFAGFATQLQTIGLQLRDIPGDGNCLFRALGDQFEGHGRNHLQHREDIVQYIKDNRELFEPFVEDDVPFDRHVSNLRKSGTYAGNDAIVAFARLKELTVIIHQLNAPVLQVSGNDKAASRELHIAYHNGDHYSSVRKVQDNASQPTNFKTTSVGTVKVQNPKHTATSKGNRNSTFESPCVELSGACAAPSCVVPSQLTNGDVDEVELNIMQIIELSGCQDVNLVRESLQDNFYDVPTTVDSIISLLAYTNQSKDLLQPPNQDESLWGCNGTGSRLFGEGTNMQTKKETKGKTKPNWTAAGKGQERNQTNRQRKQQNRLQKKERQAERHRQRVQAEASTTTSSQEADAFVLDNLQSLSI